MTETGIRTRRNFPAETWAVVRDAYLGGETAESIQKRLGISVNSIRKRASRCGWTHAAHARAIAGSDTAGLTPVDPDQARAGAVARAAALLAAGRAVEATALLKAAEALARFVPAATRLRCAAEDSLGRRLTPEEDAEAEAEARAVRRQLQTHIEEEAARLAAQLLADESHTTLQFGLFALKWRAEHLGPEVAAHDRARAEFGGWAGHYYEDTGAFRSEEAVFGRVWQHMRVQARTAAGLRPRPDHEVPGPQTWDDVEAEKAEAGGRGPGQAGG